MSVIRVELPYHLRRLAQVDGEVQVDVATGIDRAVTLSAVLDALEAKYPVLRGTIRDHVTRQRRDFLRFFAAGEDFSLVSADAALPDVVARGAEPFLVVGALAGG